MSEFNWDAYERWGNRKEWENEPHDIDICSCQDCQDTREEQDKAWEDSLKASQIALEFEKKRDKFITEVFMGKEEKGV